MGPGTCPRGERLRIQGPGLRRGGDRRVQACLGQPQERQFEQFEFLVKPGADHDEVRDRWDEFVHSHHYDIHESFFESWLASHPRRSGEAYYRQYVEANFIDMNPVPCDLDLRATIDWYGELIGFETDEED